MRKQVSLTLLAAIAAVLVCVPHKSMADVRYTMATSMGAGAQPASSGGMGTPDIRTTTMIKDQREREERTMDMGPMHQVSVTLTECDKRQVIEMNPDLKIYTVQSMDTAMSVGGPTSMGPTQYSHPSEKAGVGKMISTISVQALGTEKILDLTTQHSMMTTQEQSSGCAGDSNSTTKIEMWVAPIKVGLDCPERYSPTRSGTTESGCQMTYEQHGDLNAVRGLFDGMPVREKIYQGDRVIMEMDMREYSTAALDPSLFEVPADYKLVSRQDFEKAQEQAMEQSMRNAASQPSSTDSQTQDNSSNSQTSGGDSSDQNSQNGSSSGDQSNDQNNNQNNSGQSQHQGGFHMPHLPF